MITGISGFIGNALSREMRASGYNVWGIDNTLGQDEQIVCANLLDLDETIKAAQIIPRCTVLIHTAALAHRQKAPLGKTSLAINTDITKNVLKAFEGNVKHIIFLSSVAVYGENRRNDKVTVSDDLKPSTDYGKSKMLCEKMILKSNIDNCDILRLAPVFDQNHMTDIQKRVFIPCLRTIKIIIKPSPQYSLANVNTVIQSILHVVSRGPAGQKMNNVADSMPYYQFQLASWFPGLTIVFPVVIAKPFFWLSYILPRIYGSKIRGYYLKLFHSNVFEVNTEATTNIDD